MHKQSIPEGSEESTRLDRTILNLLVNEDTQRPWTEAELARAIDTPGHVPTALKRLRVAGLIHRWNDLVSAARPAVRFHEITQSVDPDSEHECHHDCALLELLLSDADENRPLTDKEIRRALGASKKGRKLDTLDALDRLDGAGLVDRRAGLAVASEAARRFDHIMTL